VVVVKLRPSNSSDSSDPFHPDNLRYDPPQVVQISVSDRRKDKRLYIPSFPLWALVMIVEADAGKALPLILALHRQWRMSRKGSVRLSGSLWYTAGRPTPRERRTILAHLRRVPGLVVVKERRSLSARYDLVKGPLWDNPPPDPALYEGFGELD
jgi:hypothetical protein